MASTPDIPRRPRVIGARRPHDLTVSDWSIAATRSALKLHLDGDFHRSALLADTMRGDDRIASDLRTRVHGITGLPFRLEASVTGDQRRAAAVRDELDAAWPRCFPGHVARDLLRPSAFLGVSYGAVTWTAERGRWWFQVDPWHGQHLRWDSTRETFQAQTRSGPMDVVAGSGEWLLHTPEGPRGWVDAAVRGLAIPYHLRTNGRLAWGRFNERHGLPILGAVVPENADKDDKDDFFADLRTMGAEGIVLLPKDENGKGFALEMIEPKNVAAYKSFDGVIYHCDVSIGVTFLGQAAHAQEGGSYAKATELGTMTDVVTTAEAKALGETVYSQLCRPWAMFNYGDAELAPRPVWDATPPEDASRLATTLSTAGTALSTWQEAAARQGYELDFEQIAKRFNVPLKRLTEKS